MLIILNVTRMLAYCAIGALSYWGPLPWWSAPLAVLWDAQWYKIFRLPWKRFEPPTPLPAEDVDQLDLSKLLQLRATMTKQDGEVLH